MRANPLKTPCWDELVARRAARLRTGAGRGSAFDAIVIAFAEGTGGVVLTQDPKDLKALATLAPSPGCRGASLNPLWFHLVPPRPARTLAVRVARRELRQAPYLRGRRAA